MAKNDARKLNVVSPNLKTRKKLLPINPLVFVSESNIGQIKASGITFETVGQKIFGLVSLPSVWTFPFFGVSADLFRLYLKAKSRKPLVNRWGKQILEAAYKVGINPNDKIL